MQGQRENCVFFQPFPTVILYKLIARKAQIPTLGVNRLMGKLMFERFLAFHDYFFHNTPSTQNSIQIPISGIAFNHRKLV